MTPLLFALEDPHGLAEGLLRHTSFDAGEIERRQFPDGESYARLLTPRERRVREAWASLPLTWLICGRTRHSGPEKQ